MAFNMNSVEAEVPVIDDPRKKFPVIKNFYDAVVQNNELINAVLENPIVDVVYFFPTLFDYAQILQNEHHHNGEREHYSKAFATEPWNWCVAGSAAVHKIRGLLERACKHRSFDRTQHTPEIDAERISQLLKMDKGPVSDRDFILFVRKNLERLVPAEDWQCRNEIKDILRYHVNFPSEIRGKFEPTDTDIFFLGSDIPNRMTVLGADIVHTRAKTVEELLLNFDLPCCRAAFNSRNDFWVSAQCLAALFNGVYYMPNYIGNLDMFTALLQKYRRGDTFKVSPKDLYARMQMRIQKFAARGFACIGIDTNIVLPWIINRFHYGEWKLEPCIHPVSDPMIDSMLGTPPAEMPPVNRLMSFTHPLNSVKLSNSRVTLSQPTQAAQPEATSFNLGEMIKQYVNGDPTANPINNRASPDVGEMLKQFANANPAVAALNTPSTQPTQPAQQKATSCNLGEMLKQFADSEPVRPNVREMIKQFVDATSVISAQNNQPVQPDQTKIYGVLENHKY